MTTRKEWQAKNPILLARERQGLTRSDLAVDTGCSPSAIQQWEAGATRPTPESVERLTEVLGPVLGQQLDTWHRRRPKATT